MNDHEIHIWAVGYIKGVINCLYNQKTITTRTYNDMLANINLINNIDNIKKDEE